MKYKRLYVRAAKIVKNKDRSAILIANIEIIANFHLPTYPDNTIILVRTSFPARNRRQDKDRQLSNFEKLLSFFIAHAPMYGFTTIAFDGLGIDVYSDKTEYGFNPQTINRYQATPISMLSIPEPAK